MNDAPEDEDGLRKWNLVSRKALAQAIRSNERTLARWAAEGRGPAVVKVGAMCCYWITDANSLCAQMGVSTFASHPDYELNKEETLKLISRKDLARDLGLSEETLKKWAANGEGPKYLRLGRKAHYRLASVFEWLRGRTRMNEKAPTQ